MKTSNTQRLGTVFYTKWRDINRNSSSWITVLLKEHER